MFRAANLSLALVLFTLIGCKRAESRPPPVELTSAKVEATPQPQPAVEVEVDGDLPILVVRGAKEHRVQMVLLAGMCTHPEGYVTPFTKAASARGDLIALQGDIACEDQSSRRWSSDVAKLDQRIDAAFQAAGLGEPKNLIIIGYSQGASRAERLVARRPDKYAKAILMGSPNEPSARALQGAQAVALVAGTEDMAFNKMKGALPDLRDANIRAAFFEIPEATHGEMASNDLMNEVLNFVEGDTK